MKLSGNLQCEESNFEIRFQVLKKTESALVEANAVAKTYNSVFVLSSAWLPMGRKERNDRHHDMMTMMVTE